MVRKLLECFKENNCKRKTKKCLESKVIKVILKKCKNFMLYGKDMMNCLIDGLKEKLA